MDVMGALNPNLLRGLFISIHRNGQICSNDSIKRDTEIETDIQKRLKDTSMQAQILSVEWLLIITKDHRLQER